MQIRIVGPASASREWSSRSIRLCHGRSIDRRAIAGPSGMPQRLARHARLCPASNASKDVALGVDSARVA